MKTQLKTRQEKAREAAGFLCGLIITVGVIVIIVLSGIIAPFLGGSVK